MVGTGFRRDVLLPLGEVYIDHSSGIYSMNQKVFHNPYLKKTAASFGVIYTSGKSGSTQPGYQGG